MANEYINWYPGHMKKTRELIQENLKLINAAIEIFDARIPISSKNPIIDDLIQNKRRIVILNKSDLADPKVNEKWIRHFKAQGAETVCMNALSGEGMADLYRVMNKMKDEINKDSIRMKPLRAMIVGVPNVGKSSLINRIAGKKSAKTGNKPGVTRGKQWINIQNQIQLLDTPGILWPKFEDNTVALKLSFCGSIKDEILDREDLSLELIKVLVADYPDLLIERYKLDTVEGEPVEILEAICRKRGFIMSGDRIDYARGARTLMDEFRAGTLGRISLESPEDIRAEKTRTGSGSVEGGSSAKDRPAKKKAAPKKPAGKPEAKKADGGRNAGGKADSGKSEGRRPEAKKGDGGRKSDGKKSIGNKPNSKKFGGRGGSAKKGHSKKR